MTSPLLVSPGRDGDIREVVDYVSTKYPQSDLFAAGFSIGGNNLAKMCGIDGESCKLKAAYCC